MRTRRYLSAIAAAALLWGTTCMAETQGDVGPTSQGTSVISMTIPKLVLITGMANLAFGTYDGQGDETLDEDICIYSNMEAAGNTYQVTATGSGAASAFTITDSTDTIAYTLKYNDEASPNGVAIDTPGSPLELQTGWTNDAACSSDNANYQVTFAESDLLAVHNGVYSGTLTLLIEPE